MPAYQTQPYIVGQTHGLKEVFRSAKSQLMRVGILGDSRTDPQQSVVDNRMECRLNYQCFRQFGMASETPIARCGYSTRSSSLDPQFCVPVAFAYGTTIVNTAVAPIADLPPGFGYYKLQTNVATHGVAVGLDPQCTSIRTTHGDFPHGGKGPFFPDAGVKSEFFFRRNETIETPRFNWVDVATNSVTPSVSPSGFSQNVAVNPFDTSVATGNVLKYTSPVHNTPTAGNYLKGLIICQNAAGASYTGANGMEIAGARFVDSNNRGMVVQSFGAGNYDAAEVLDLHGSMGPTIATMGPYHAWLIILGANDQGSPSYANPLTNYKGKIQDLIDFVRGTTVGGTSRTPIVLCNPYLRTGAQATFDTFTEQLIELAAENPDVVFLNVARALEDAKYAVDNTAFTGDGVHMGTDMGAMIYHDIVWGLLQVAGEGGAHVTSADLITAIKADAVLGINGVVADLTTVKSKTALLGTGRTLIDAAVNGTDLVSPLVIGDDYASALGNAFEFNFNPGGATIGSSACTFGGKRVDGAEDWQVDGTLSDNGDGTWKATFELEDTDTSALVPGFYNWTVEFSNGTETKTIARGERVRWVERYTD